MHFWVISDLPCPRLVSIVIEQMITGLTRDLEPLSWAPDRTFDQQECNVETHLPRITESRAMTTQ
jgi:hypothetical protein